MPEPFIESESQLGDFLASFGKSDGVRRCSVDTEADSLHSYQEKLCLIQFSCDERHAIIDPLAIQDLSALLEFLEPCEIWMHGADFDMSMFRKTFNLIPKTVKDTQSAARLVGYRKFGLAHMVSDVFDVELSKQSQRANWGKRPLSDKMLEYAVNDVRYIIDLADTLVARLQELGRMEWFDETCEMAREAVLERTGPDPDEVWRISGWGKLHPKGLAYLRGFWHWRNQEAERLDRPPFKVMTNDKLLEFSAVLESGQAFELPSRPYSGAQRRRFNQAVKAVESLDEAEWPKRRIHRRSRKPPNLDEKVKEIRAVRDASAEELDIDPTLIAPKSLLELLVIDEKAAKDQLMQWQRKLLGV